MARRPNLLVILSDQHGAALPVRFQHLGQKCLTTN